MTASSRKQPHRLPPPLLWPGDRLLSGALLGEHEGGRGLALWKTVRTMIAVTALEPQELLELRDEAVYASRGALVRESFSELAWREPLLRLAGVYADDGGDSSSWCSDCLAIARLAVNSSAPATALEFTQAAAMLKMDDVRAARLAGVRARSIGVLPAAEMWFAHAINRGRRSSQHGEVVSAYIGLAAVQRQRGARSSSRRTLRRALRKAHRRSLSELLGPLHHEAVLLAISLDRPKAVIRHTRAALQAYGPYDDRVATLAQDVAVTWSNNGFFREALVIFDRLPEKHGSSLDQLTRAASTARAAGALGDRSLFHSALAAATPLLRRATTAAAQSTALLDLARGALSLGEFAAAESYARQAQTIARRRSESLQERDAEGLLQTIADAHTKLGGVTERVRTSRKVTALTAEITQSLRGL